MSGVLLLALLAVAGSASSSALRCDAGYYASTITDASGVWQPACKPCPAGHYADAAGTHHAPEPGGQMVAAAAGAGAAQDLARSSPAMNGNCNSGEPY